MMSANEIIKNVKTLPRNEQERVLAELEKSLKSTSEVTLTDEDEIERILLAEGLISQIPPREYDEEEETWEPIEVPGKPLSEIILEDRI